MVGWLVIGLVLVGFYAYQYLMKQERKNGYDQAVAEYTKRSLLAEQEARQRESELTRQIQEAENAATIREQQIQTLSSAVANVSSRLRDRTTSIKNGLSEFSIDTLRQTADTALDVFGDCQGKYGELAEKADRHASDVEKLVDAWPHESN